MQKAPIVVIIEDNRWACSTPVSRRVPLRDLADQERAPCRILLHIVDGNDLPAMLQTTRQAVAQAREGHGPGADRSQKDPCAVSGRTAATAGVLCGSQEMVEYWKR